MNDGYFAGGDYMAILSFISLFDFRTCVLLHKKDSGQLTEN